MVHHERLRGAQLRVGVASDLYSRPIQADVCAAVLRHDGSSEHPPHQELNANLPQVGTALHWATDHSLADASLALLECRHFAQVNARRDLDGSTALHTAAAAGLEEVVEALIGHPDMSDLLAVDRDGFTALHGAAYCGRLSCVKVLLGSPGFESAVGAVGLFNVARPPGHWARRAAEEYDMQTALHMAAARGHEDVCAAILAIPNQPEAANATNRMGATALHMAARSKHVAACRAILRSGEFTALNERDVRGFTALHWAAQEDASCDIAAAILACEDFQALDSRDLRGRTASDIGKAKGNHEVQRMILHRGGLRALAPRPEPLTGKALSDLLAA